MSRLIDIQTIRKEIECKRDAAQTALKIHNEDGDKQMFGIAALAAGIYANLLDFLDTLPEENAFEKKPFWVEGKGVFIPTINKILAPEDYDDGRGMTWDEAMKVGDIGSKRNWLMVLYWLDEVQALLREHGGKELECWIWTGTEYKDNPAIACYLNMYFSYVDSTTKSYSLRVRPFSAYQTHKTEAPEDTEQIPDGLSSQTMIQMWEEELSMLKDKDFRGDAEGMAYTAFIDGVAKGYTLRTSEELGWEKPDEKPVSIEDAIVEYYGRIPDSEDTIEAAKHFYSVGQTDSKVVEEESVDLEEMIEDEMPERYCLIETEDDFTEAVYSERQMKLFAEKFFNLGRKAKKD